MQMTIANPLVEECKWTCASSFASPACHARRMAISSHQLTSHSQNVAMPKDAKKTFVNFDLQVEDSNALALQMTLSNHHAALLDDAASTF